ncbi:MAG: hypothetical protein HY671_09635 [Chloroflexi bacterium]|nr:hypothetical protein [Chloroflexota bacterium]
MQLDKVREWLPFFRGHGICSKCHLRVEFTGVPPGNPAEELIAKVAGSRRSVSLHWLEERLADALYYAELDKGGGVNDIGVWGCAVFCKESARMIGEMRPEFAVVRDANSGH